MVKNFKSNLEDIIGVTFPEFKDSKYDLDPETESN